RRAFTHAASQHLRRQPNDAVAVTEVVEISVDDLQRLRLRPAHRDRLRMRQRGLLIEGVDVEAPARPFVDIVPAAVTTSRVDLAEKRTAVLRVHPRLELVEPL